MVIEAVGPALGVAQRRPPIPAVFSFTAWTDLACAVLGARFPRREQPRSLFRSQRGSFRARGAVFLTLRGRRPRRVPQACEGPVRRLRDLVELEGTGRGPVAPGRAPTDCVLPHCRLPARGRTEPCDALLTLAGRAGAGGGRL